ncbi:histidine kinase [Winogradskyella sp. R77965]|uniref:histidine kinase n=1 Tax=Winogradskyella sp. R77965 TaxID=3093872 RepID=UPI0037DC3DC8
MIESLKQLLAYPHDNGFTTFVLGILFVLFVYHFLLYFQNRDKAYLFYSIYTFLIFINQTKFVLHGDDGSFIESYNSLMSNYHKPIVWVYNIFYFVFGFTFLNLKIYSKKWYNFIFRIVFILFFVSLSTTLIYIFTGNFNYINNVESVIIPSLYIFGIIAYYSLFSVKMPLRSYIIVGSFILYISSFTAEYLYSLEIFKDTNTTSSIFYIGVIIENIIFSLGLGHKQKMILQDKNESQERLIIQLKENEKLKNDIQLQLEKNVINLSKEAEIEKLQKIKAEYDKELAELKIASLRSQMNPHFIFNSLNAIKLYIIDNKQESAVYYLNKFSKLIRKILASTREKEITLAEEIETIKLYIDIENIRFNNEIEAIYTIDKTLNLDTIKIPALILQPFVENSIWHGLSLKKENKKLKLKISKKGQTHIKIEIEDNGIGREKSALIKKKKMYKKESIGINLTKERLSNFEKEYINNYTIKFKDLYNENNSPVGTNIIMNIPLL